MDFNDTPENAEFRAELRNWLESIVATLGEMPDNYEERLAWWRPWQQQLHSAGYAGLAWPKEYGGRAAGAIQQAIFYEECDRAGAPDRLDVIGSGFAGPTIMEHGTDAQKKRYLNPILLGEQLWCQLFSEPGAGSDLAALKTKAIQVEGGWKIEGQKVWTSLAQISEYAILLARTSDAPRHKGISLFYPADEAGRCHSPSAEADDRFFRFQRGIPGRGFCARRKPRRRVEWRMARGNVNTWL